MKHRIDCLKKRFVGAKPMRHCVAVLMVVGILPLSNMTPAVVGQELPVRKTIQRSIPFIEAEGDGWIQEQKCISCHQVPFMVWSLNWANRRGFDVDLQGLERTNRWATDWINLTNPKRRKDAKEEATLLQENDAVAQLLIGGPQVRQDDQTVEADTSDDWRSQWHASLLGSQQEEGAWKPRGQLPLQKRPKRETHEVSTVWALLAVMGYGSSPVAESKSVDLGVIEKAKEWLGNDTAGESTEWWSVKLLLAHALELPSVEKWQVDLRKHQNDDGGWGFRCDEASDAFGTGVAIYALAHSGVATSDSDVQRALKFLITSQKPDGSWTVNGTKKTANNQPTATATYWGTCWAAIGMMETLPKE